MGVWNTDGQLGLQCCQYFATAALSRNLWCYKKSEKIASSEFGLEESE